jgi:hypothetical protein
MEQSILKSTKKLLNIGLDDDSFDLDIITHINSAFSVLHDLGIGPLNGFIIEDDLVEWSEYLPDEEDQVELNKVKSIVWLRARLAFDPPNSGFLLDSFKAQLQEQEWRLNVNREETEWVDPDPPAVLVVDGGDPSEVIPPSTDFDGGPA